jgi:DNA (cytosine-5)-methyltransferase 1
MVMLNNVVMPKVKLLDLCCKAGGCSVGYDRAAKELGIDIDIVGVDIEEQPNYPFKFIKGDAAEFLKNNYNDFTHLHASPPCQLYSKQSANERYKGKQYSNFLDIIKPLMYGTALPGVIENVMDAPIRGDICLRGDMFGLKTLRKRKFELINWFMMQPGLQYIKPGSVVHRGEYITCTGNGNNGSMNKQKKFTPFIHKKNTVAETWSFAMKIDWMTTDEMREAIPPSYTHLIGLEFFAKVALIKNTMPVTCG